MVELKGKQLLVSVILSLLVMGALGYTSLPQAYCPLENTTVRYIHMSETRKTVTKVLPSKDAEEGWTIVDDRCQKGMQIGEWIPINTELLKYCPECPWCPVECPSCPACECTVECKDCPSCPTCPSNGTCPTCPPCVQTCSGCYRGGGDCGEPCPECPGTTCPPCVDCDNVDIIAYTDIGKFFCDGIGIDASCIRDETLEMPWG